MAFVKTGCIDLRRPELDFVRTPSPRQTDIGLRQSKTIWLIRAKVAPSLDAAAAACILCLAFSRLLLTNVMSHSRLWACSYWSIKPVNVWPLPLQIQTCATSDCVQLGI